MKNFIRTMKSILFNKRGEMTIPGANPEPTQEGQGGTEPQQQNQQTDTVESMLEKFKALLDAKTNEGVQEKIAKNLVGEDKANELLGKYKEEQEKTKNDFTSLQNEVETLRQQIRDKAATAALQASAKNANLSDNGLKALMKLSDKNALFGKDGKMVGGKADEIVKAFVAEFPEFVKNEQPKQQGFFQSAPQQSQNGVTKEVTNEDLFAKHQRWTSWNGK